MDALRLASAAATASHRAAPAFGIDTHGVQRAAVWLGEAPAQVPVQTRLHDLPVLSATALRLALPTLLLARQAFDLNRRDTATCLRTAELLLEQHRPTEVLDCLDLLDASVERSAAWHLVRANALSVLRDDRQAVRDATAAVAKAGSDAALHQQALLQLGQNLTRLQEHAEAGWCYQTALAAQPQAADAALATALGSAADLDWDSLPAHIDRLLACMAQPPSAAHQPLAVPLDPSQLIPLLDHPLLQRWLAALACQQRHSAGVGHEKPKASTRDHRRQGRWRLGILTGGRGSGSALEPSVAALFDAFDPQQVELYIYSDACSNHPRAVDAKHWHDSRHASTDDLVGLIRSDRIDLLLDLTGPGGDSRLGVLAHRPAPVQVAWLGHAGTTGAPWVGRVPAACAGLCGRRPLRPHRRAPAARHPGHGATPGTARLAAARADTEHSARDLEHLLTRMVARNDAGLPPTPLAAEPAPRRD